MAAPKNNQFWKLRSKHGRDKLFATPELLWEAACEYFDWCDKHPWEETKIKTGKIAGTERTPVQRPYTITGLCLYLDANASFWRNFREGLKEGDEDFSAVITRIEEIIETQQFEGACIGTFNANIIARKLGLADKQQQEVSGNITTGLKIVVQDKEDIDLIKRMEEH